MHSIDNEVFTLLIKYITIFIIQNSDSIVSYPFGINSLHVIRPVAFRPRCNSRAMSRAPRTDCTRCRRLIAGNAQLSPERDLLMLSLLLMIPVMQCMYSVVHTMLSLYLFSR